MGSASPSQARACTTTPLSVDRYKLQVTISGETLEKLKLAQDMLSHAIPSGDAAAVLDRALSLLVAELARNKFAATERPRPGRPTAEGSRHIPADVKRAVWVRDLGRCAFVSADGRRCLERRFIEFHHIKPLAVGGEATVPGISLRCGAHNRHEARLFFARDDDGSSIAREPVVAYGEAAVPANSVWTEYQGLRTVNEPGGVSPHIGSTSVTA